MKTEMTASRKALGFISARAAILVLALIGGITACMVPVDTTEPIGKVVSFRVPAGDQASIRAIHQAFDSRKKSLVEETQPDGALKLTYVLPGMKESEIEQIMGRLGQNVDLKDVKVHTLSATVRESLASSILYKTFRTHIDARGLSDEELRKTIEQQLAASGMENPSVSIRKNDDGIRTFDIKTEGAGKGSISVDVTMDDEGKKVREVIKRHNGPIPGGGRMPRTDQDIREMVKANHPDLKLEDKDIDIQHDGDEVNVTITKDGQEMKMKLMMKHKEEKAH